MLTHTIVRKKVEQSMKQSIQSDAVILNTGEPLFLDKGRGSKEMTINNNANSEMKDKMKLLIDLSTYQSINFNNYSLAHLWERARVRSAFTLAEVLITLGIIGIVAAMTIPTLISKNQKRVIEAKLKEDYSIIQQVIKSNESNDVDMSMLLKDEDANSQKEWFETYFAPYMKYSHVCYDEAGCWQKRGDNKNLAGNATQYNRKDIGIGLNVVTLKLNNGTNICLDVFDSLQELAYLFGVNATENGLAIYIDTNGDSGPNVIGKDIYVLVYSPDNGIVPAGIHKTNEEINKNCSSAEKGQNAGYYCIMRVKNNGWEIPNDVWNIKV